MTSNKDNLLAYQFITGCFTIFYSLTILLLLIIPLYIVDGVVKGFIAFSFYQLKMGDTRIRMPELEKAISLSAPIILNSLSLLVLGLNSVTYWVYRRHNPLLARLMFPASLASIFSTIFSYMTHTVYIGRVVESLAGEYVETNSAGILILGSVTIEASPLVSIMLSPLPLLILSILNAIFSTMWVLQVYSRLSS
uniref:Uncharacterized protein n=1 Tax=Thermosphaera aggregans TaxID=54254 RepID=A0A7C2FDJ7_9CREN